ncbi:MAG TPA: hypothetical protein VG056_06380 [Pirellulales bacterium]|jgi:hypothetical protein|nr:hypothetical protein [Pirellulales bacterium]
MQAAVVSMLLMAGACGNSGEPLPAPTPVVSAAAQSWQPSSCDYSTMYPSPAGGVYHHVGLFGCPQYSPVWLLKDCAAFYPGNYAVPYDYREIFNYPWHGPRPMAPMQAIEIETAAKPAAKSVTTASHSAARASNSPLTTR